MNSKSALRYAIAAVLGVGSTGVTAAAIAAEAGGASDEIQEVTVTAQRRSENLQNVPISIQALTSETLTQLNVQTFDDFVRYLPNVTAASQGPGQSAIFMRGLSTTLAGSQGSGGVGSFSSVAIYLDEVSGSLPGRNLDVYATDLERIEILEGPQGTLFGAGAESGVMRYITNKPKLNTTEGSASTAYEVTAHGDPSANGQAVLNLPLITDRLALRAVVYSDNRGGYINNIPSTFTRQPSDFTIGIYEGGVVPTGPGSVNTINNYSLARDGINTVDYQGMRVSLLYKINDDWDALLAQSYQSMDSNGQFFEEPHSSSVNPALQQPLPDLSVQMFEPSYNHDKFELTSLTVNGKVGDLKFVYSGGFLVRNIDQQGDYTAYSRGVNAAYYQCNPLAAGAPLGSNTCYSPAAYWHDKEQNRHQSHEMRLSTPDDWRLRGLVGVFYEDFLIHENIDWFYKSVASCTTLAQIDCLTNVGPPPNSGANNPSIRPDNESYFDDITRGYKQTAVFGSVDYDILPKVLTATVGTRYFHTNETETGFSASSFNCYAAGPPPCTANQSIAGDSNNETANNFNTTYSGFKSRANLSWHVTPDMLLYYTWSQGFRPGGFNRGATQFSSTAGLLSYTFITPARFTPDTLVNNEIGWKTQWLDHRLEFNGAIYQEDWKNIQVELFLPQNFGNLSFVANGPNYTVKGLELSMIARPLHGLTVTAAASWNSSNQNNVAYLNDVNGNPITSVRAFGDPGAPLALSPPLQANLRVRYEFPLADALGFIQVGGMHQAHSISSIASVTTAFRDQPGFAYDQPGFSQYDASFGFSRERWTMMMYGENLTDTRADLYENPNQFVDAKIVSRPRTIGLRALYKF
jgi:iron complex outermembrane recepter protein